MCDTKVYFLSDVPVSAVLFNHTNATSLKIYCFSIKLTYVTLRVFVIELLPALLDTDNMTLYVPVLLKTCDVILVVGLVVVSEKVHCHLVGICELVSVNFIVAPCFSVVGE
jgi:hypothetical protein